MQLVDIQNVTKSYNEKILFKINHLIVNKKDHIGVIGNNGTGKTTLLKIICKKEKIDSGNIILKEIPELINQEHEKSIDNSLSGGENQWKMIMNQLIYNPAFLMIDEPTNNLDYKHIDKLIDLLKKFQGTFVIVSHDRYFLDNTCNKIWEIKNSQIKEYLGNYSDFKKMEYSINKNKEELWTAQNKKKRQLEKAIIKKQAQVKKSSKVPRNIGNNEAIHSKSYYNGKSKKLSKDVDSIRKNLDNLDKVDKPYQEKIIKLNIHYSNILKNKSVIKFIDFSGTFHNQNMWKPFNGAIKGTDKVALIGDNGVGKSTFIDQVYKNKNNAIEITPQLKMGYFSQRVKNLNLNKTIIDNIDSTSINELSIELSLLASFGINRELFNNRVKNLSSGQRTKISLVKILLSDINFLLLDEPTNFLDIQAINALEKFILNFEGAVLFATHDKFLINNSATNVWKIDAKYGYIKEKNQICKS